jgi:hypothetical protein
MRRPASVGLSALVGGLLAACGGPAPSAPGSSPEPASAGFLHVLRSGSVLSYVVDAATGRLRFGAEQVVGDAHTIAGEPQGHYVYAAFGPRSAQPPTTGRSRRSSRTAATRRAGA